MLSHLRGLRSDSSRRAINDHVHLRLLSISTSIRKSPHHVGRHTCELDVDGFDERSRVNARHKNLITPLQNPRFREGPQVVNFRSKKLAHLRERPTPVELATNIVQKLRKGALDQPVALAQRKARPRFELGANWGRKEVHDL